MRDKRHNFKGAFKANREFNQSQANSATSRAKETYERKNPLNFPFLDPRTLTDWLKDIESILKISGYLHWIQKDKRVSPTISISSLRQTNDPKEMSIAMGIVASSEKIARREQSEVSQILESYAAAFTERNRKVWMAGMDTPFQLHKNVLKMCRYTDDHLLKDSLRVAYEKIKLTSTTIVSITYDYTILRRVRTSCQN